MLQDQVLNDIKKVKRAKWNTLDNIKGYIEQDFSLTEDDIDSDVVLQATHNVLDGKLNPHLNRIIENTETNPSDEDLFDKSELRLETLSWYQDIKADVLDKGQNIYQELNEGLVSGINDKLDDGCIKELQNLHNRIDDEIDHMESFLYKESTDVDDLASFYREESEKTRSQLELVQDARDFTEKYVGTTDLEVSEDDIVNILNEYLEQETDYNEFVDIVDFLEYDFNRSSERNDEPNSFEDDETLNPISLYDDLTKTRNTVPENIYSFTKKDDVSGNLVDRPFNYLGNSDNQSKQYDMFDDVTDGEDLIILYDDLDKTRNASIESSVSSLEDENSNPLVLYENNQMVEY